MRVVSNKQKKSILYLVSIIASVLIWIFTTYSENPQIDITINTIDINFVGEQNLIENELMIINKADIPPAQLVLRGKRRDLMGVLGNIAVNVDVSTINGKGIYKITPTFDIPSNAVYISKRITNYIEFEVADISRKTVDVRILEQNADKNSSRIVESIPEMTEFDIGGYADDIEAIDHIALNIDIGEMTNDNEKDYQIVFENKENLPVGFKNEVFASKDTIRVKNNVYKRVTLPISFTLPKNVSNGNTVKILSSEKNSVDVGLKNKKADEIKSISTIDNFDKVTASTTTHYAELDVPDNIYVPEQNKRVKLSIEVFKSETKTITVPVTVTNDDGAKYSVLDKTVDVTVSGPAQKLTVENINAVLDISKVSKTAGTYNVKLEISTKQNDVTVENKDIFANIEIK